MRRTTTLSKQREFALPQREPKQFFHSFYDVLLAGSRNEIARRILGTLEARITYLRYLTTQRAPQARQLRTVALLRGIFEAVEKRRADQAARRCAAFVRRSAAFALEVLTD